MCTVRHQWLTIAMICVISNATARVDVLVSTLAGGGGAQACHSAGYQDGPASHALFNLPARVQAVAVPATTADSAPTERLFVLDTHNGCIRSFLLGASPGEAIVRSDTGCGANSSLAFLGPDARFPNGTSRNWPWIDGPLDFWVSTDTLTIWVLDTYNNKLKSATKNHSAAEKYGPWVTVAGSGALGTDDGNAASATFFQPHGMAVAETTGFLYVSDTFASCIRSISLATGMVTTVAGKCGRGGHRDGSSAIDARFNHVHKVTVDPRNESILYVSEVQCSGDGPLHLEDPCKASYNGIAFTGVRKLEMWANGSCASVTTIAGYYNHTNPQKDPTGFTDGPVGIAKFNYVHAVALQPFGKPDNAVRGAQMPSQAGKSTRSSSSTELYICDDNNYRIRKLDVTTGMVTTLAGNGTNGCADGDGTAATFGAVGLGVGADGTVYVADYLNHRIRKLVYQL